MNNPLLDFYRALPHEPSLLRMLHREQTPRCNPAAIRQAFENSGVPWPQQLDRLMEEVSVFGGGVSIMESIARYYAVWRWAWSVPTPNAVRLLVRQSPLVEIGAGRGYWASLIGDAGGDIIAFDKKPNCQAPPPQGFTALEDIPLSFAVETGGPEQAANYPDRTLFLSWPPYHDPMAAACLNNYQGNTVVYIGEYDGCTADSVFREMLDSAWETVNSIALPQWHGLHDSMWIYKRR